MPLRALSKINLKVELQRGSPVQRIGVHASACGGQGESSAQPQCRNQKGQVRVAGSSWAFGFRHSF